MIILKNTTLRRGTKMLLDNVHWTLHAGQRIAIIGANGTGKTSLFSLLLGKIEADAGELYIPKHLTLAHVAQETPALTQSALDFTLDGDTRLREIERDIRQAELDNDGEQIAHLYADYGHIDGYTANARASSLLAGLGFANDEHNQAVNSFSGGWRMRLNLAQALMAPSDVLLLDEPTNHLDLDAILWLEQWLHNYPGTLLLISHDQEFIDKLATHIVHLDNKKLDLYTGNYTDFERIRAEKLSLQQAMHEKQVRQKEHMQKFVDRFRYTASKARQAQSRLKAIEKMEIIASAQVDRPFNFSFPTPKKLPNPLLYLRDAEIGYNNTPILKDVNITLTPNMRLGLLGPNGAGKSTLIKAIAGEIALLSGNKQRSDDLQLGYFAQHQVDHLRNDRSPIDHLRAIDSKTSDQDFRNHLGQYNFRSDMAFDPINHFSGGEKARLALALIIWQKPNVLLLDEPTNHLDIDMRQALCEALQTFEGALVVVSHDRYLLRTTCDELVIVHGKKVHDFDGDLEDYARWLLQREKKIAEKKATIVTPKQSAATTRQALAPLLKKIKELESQIAQYQDKLSELEHSLLDTKLYEDKNKITLQKTIKEQAKLNVSLEKAEEEWLQLQGKLEA